MDSLLLIAVDVAAIAVLTFALYFPRHRRRDLMIAFLVVNIGVLAVSIVLGGTGASIGVGLGLFGVLSIIRLRSSEIAQHEVAYYFAALAIGLIAGLSGTLTWTVVGLVALLLIAVAVGDSPLLLRRYRQQELVIDRAILDEGELRRHLEHMLQAKVHQVTVTHLDLVNDSTQVDVRYELPRRAA